MAVRLLLLIAKYEVNVLYYDEWDLYRQFIPHRDSSWIDLFFYQQGPHRQGIGYLLMQWIAAASHWNTRAMSFAVAMFMFAAAALVLVLKVRLFGKIAWHDAIIPLIFLAPIQYENLLGAANLSSTSLPIFLFALYALAWTIAPRTCRYLSVLALNFLLIYCGYGFFVGLITPVLLAIDLAHAFRARERADAPVLALLFALASLASFFVGYRYSRAAGCLAYPAAKLWSYPWFAAEMFANVVRLKGHGIAPTVVGFALAALAVSIGATSFVTLWKQRPAGPRTYVLFAFSAFSLLYAADAAIGRICFGVEYGQSSRYAPYLFPAFLAFYFALLEWPAEPRRTRALALYASVLVVAAVFLAPRDRRTLVYYREGKQQWKSCYITYQDAVRCGQQTGFAFYPSPNSVDLRRELDYMQQNHLNLFR